MPSKVRIISPKNSGQWDDLVRDVINGNAWEQEHDYFGITSQDRADKVRRALRTAGRHVGVSVKAYWKECPDKGQCTNGGADCKFHVKYTVYDLDKARAYKTSQASRR